MPNLPRLFRPPQLGPRRTAEASRQAFLAKRRGTKHERGYDARWDRASVAYRREHPLCVCCKANGVVEAVALVDHIIPHKGDRELFWDRDNWQSLCERCDKTIKRALEHLFADGKVPSCDLNLSRVFPEHFG